MIRISFYGINIYGCEEILNRGSEFWRIREKNIIFSAHESKYESTRCTIDSSTADFSTRLWYLYSVTRTNSFLHTIPTSQLYFFLLLFSSTPIRFLFSSFSCSRLSLLFPPFIRTYLNIRILRLFYNRKTRARARTTMVTF